MTAIAKSFLLPEEDPELRRWFISAGIVIAIHAALVSWLMHRRDISAAGAPAAVVMIDLPIIDIPKNTEAQPEAVETPEPEAMAIPELPPAQKPVAVLMPQAKPKAKPKKKEILKPVLKQPHERPAPYAQRRQVSAASRLGASGSARAAWAAEIIAHLRQHTPSAGESTGVVSISFSLTRGGHLLGARLASSSGSSTLDQKALQMARSANPYPPAPAEVAEGAYSFTVPVHFK